MIKSLILIAFWMFIVPIVLGYGVLKFDKKGNKNACLALILGFFVELLVFSILAIPMTFLKCTFTLLKISWAVIMIILSAVSIFFNRKNVKEIVKQNFDEIKGLPKILTIVFLVLLIIQCYYPFKYMYEDYDDSNFVAKATIAIDTDTLFKYDDAGYEYESFPTRTVLSQFPHYTATIASLSDIHPAVLAHTIFPVVFIIIAYGFYYVFGKSLFKQDSNKAMIFLVLLSVIYMFGDYSRYTNFVRLLCRSWQGKSLVANLTIPFIWYVFIEYIGKENSKFGWILLGLCLTASITFSSMAFILPPIMVAILLLLYAIKDKKKGYIITLGGLFIIAIIGVSVYLTVGNPIVKNETLQNEELTFVDKAKVFMDEVKSEENLNLVRESFDRAGGGNHYFALFTIAIIYILATSKEDKKDIVYVFAIYSIVVMLINLNPLFSKIWWIIVEKGVHWRVYWLLPIGYALAYMLTDIICLEEKKYRRIFIMILSICIIMINGKLVLNKTNFKDVDNYYKIPDHLLEILYTIQVDGEENKKIVGPEEVLVYSRQLNGNFAIEKERNVHGYYPSDTVIKQIYFNDIAKIYELFKINNCEYLVMHNNNLMNNEIVNYGFEKVCENNTYILYKLKEKN